MYPSLLKSNPLLATTFVTHLRSTIPKNITTWRPTKTAAFTGIALASLYSSTGRASAKPKSRLPKPCKAAPGYGFRFTAPLPPQAPEGEEQFANNTTSCKEPILIPIPAPPKTEFLWTSSIKRLCQRLFVDGYDLQEKPWVPYVYFTGNGHEQGREQVEVYTRFLPSHPQFPETVPELSFIPETHREHPAFPSEKHSATLMGLCHFGPFSAGPPGYTHGGLIATTADVLMYRLLEASGRKGVTAALNVQYKKPIPLSVPVIAVASMELTGPRKAHANFAIMSEDFQTLFMEANAVFVTPTGWMNDEQLKYGIGNDNTTFDNNKTTAIAEKQ